MWGETVFEYSEMFKATSKVKSEIAKYNEEIEEIAWTDKNVVKKTLEIRNGRRFQCSKVNK